jgi:hypothetical protein
VVAEPHRPAHAHDPAHTHGHDPAHPHAQGTAPTPRGGPEASPPPEPARARVQHITVRRRNAGEGDEC